MSNTRYSVKEQVELQRYQVAIHEAGHAVVAHLAGIAIDRVKVRDDGSGYSRPVREAVAAEADKLWAESTAITRKLVLADFKDGKRIWVLRKGYKRFKNGKVRGKPAPELAERVEDLRKRANAVWEKHTASKTHSDHVKDLMHSLGGPVADEVFFNTPFQEPRLRLMTKQEKRARRLPTWVAFNTTIGNQGASGDFRYIRRALKHIDDANWKEARELYRRITEQLVRQHRATIERVAKALLRRGTLSGAELVKLIEERGS